MMTTNTEQDIHELGRRLLEVTQVKSQSFFKSIDPLQKVMALSMASQDLKTSLFRLVDVMPALKTGEQVAKHIEEYLLHENSSLPGSLKYLLKGFCETSIGKSLILPIMRQNIKLMSKGFIVGEEIGKAQHKLSKLWNQGLCFTVDILGEQVLTPSEAYESQQQYLKLVYDLAKASKSWGAWKLPERHSGGSIPRANVSVKCSSLYRNIDGGAFRRTVEGVKNALRPIVSAAVANGVFVYLDMEQNDYRDVIFTVAEELFSEPEFIKYPHLGIVVQTYLMSAEEDLERMVMLAKSRGTPLTIRLVKGAYWDAEVAWSLQRGWDCPVFSQKSATDLNYETVCKKIVTYFPHLYPAFATHNIRSMAHALTVSREAGLHNSDVEIQMLYGMASVLKESLVGMGVRVRDYAPIGKIIPGMAYLVRRLLENTSNEGFLRSWLMEKAEMERLLSSPQQRLELSQNINLKNTIKGNHFINVIEGRRMTHFVNEPFWDYGLQQNRSKADEALAQVRKQLPLVIHPQMEGKELPTEDRLTTVNPSQCKEIVSEFSCATIEQADQAVVICQKHAEDWKNTDVRDRCLILRRAAQMMRDKRAELIAIIVLEVGKSYKEADADVAEAIDFCDYYAELAGKMLTSPAVMYIPGEDNQFQYWPRGIALTIAPWNFPVAILCGMTVAPLVCGNPVIMKPAEQSVASGYALYKILIEAGVPAGVLQFLPGRGEQVGAHLVAHPQIAVISFTGSRDVGMQIMKTASVLAPKQKLIKKVVAELGGKNAVIVDDDADLDEAVNACLQSSFGFAGQKCSALSRIIIHKNLYTEFKKRFSEAVQAWLVGPAEDLSYEMGPVIDRSAQERLLGALERNRAHIVAQKVLPEEMMERGFFVPPTVLACEDPSSELGQIEFFGPVVTLFKADDLEQAIQILNNVDYALTGGFFSRSPGNIIKVREKAEVGNLYINRGITGALVGRQPFGGFKLSGVGAKAGGPDYLLNFLEGRTVTENTLRRGFVPELT